MADTQKVPILHKLDMLDGYQSTLCGRRRRGELPYVKGGLESNFTWKPSMVTCKQCKKSLGASQ